MAMLALFLLLTAFVPQTTNVTVQPDLRLFTTMAALNAAGFDIEFGSQYHPVRETVRHYADNLDPELLAQLRAFYKSRKGDQTDESQLPKYISLAVSLTDPPGLKAAVREELLPPDARGVAGFADL